MSNFFLTKVYDKYIFTLTLSRLVIAKDTKQLVLLVRKIRLGRVYKF